ncbi:hypothetical protein HRbin29_00967 [bacterium HR29]|jgi:prepilin signal peptidase PulO-like enzyme (type II secretory pathway)|nr:hypothetical protein HRbin29_00967 [bacterium HR29]
MSTRALLAASIALAGFILGVVAYFVLAAPWGFPPDSVAHSNPRVPFAPAIFVAGVMMVFIAAIVYELWPGNGDHT